MTFKRIDISEARKLLQAETENPVQIVDIRDEQSYASGHIESALHLHSNNLQEFIDSADLSAPVLVYCYHGNMSQSAAAYLAEQGFKESLSLDGGYVAWSESSGT